MRRTAKKTNDKESGRSCSSKEGPGSKVAAAVQFRKRTEISLSKVHKPKHNLKKVDSTELKRKVAGSFSKGTRNDIASEKRSSNTAGRDAESLKKLDELKLQNRDTSFGSSKHDGTNARGDVKRRKSKNKRRRKDQIELDQASRLQRRTRYLMIKMKLGQNLIDASQEKTGKVRGNIKPEKELLRAKKQILKCKLGIRDVLHQLDSLSSVGSIEGSVISPDGSVYHEHIFCAKCKCREAFPDNDIVLCDGTCNCAFHQKCPEPPPDTENIPPEDEGWFCKFCEYKMEIIEAMNAHIGNQFCVDSKWQDIFKEEAAFPDDGSLLLNPEEKWPSDDSEDDDYNPKRGESSCNSGSGSDAFALDDSSCSTSLSWFLDGLGETSDEKTICSPRKRQAVDYKKLYEEMFGKVALPHEPVSEDEDWGPNKVKRREKESDAISSLMTLCESETKCQNDESRKVGKLVSDLKRAFFRMPPTAVELRQMFEENELASRATKVKLSEELSLGPEKVNKWFKNACYLAIKCWKAERKEQFPVSADGVSDDSGRQTANNKNSVAITSEDALKDNELGGPECLKRKRNPKLSGESSKKHIEAAHKESSDDVTLRKLLKRREKKKVDGGRLQEFEEVMERICRAKIRLEIIKQRLLRLANGKDRKLNRRSFHVESVIYVPVVELREKNWS